MHVPGHIQYPLCIPTTKYTLRCQSTSSSSVVPGQATVMVSKCQLTTWDWWCGSLEFHQTNQGVNAATYTADMVVWDSRFHVPMAQYPLNAPQGSGSDRHATVCPTGRSCG